MRSVRGRLIPESLAELVERGRAALFVLNVQNDWCADGYAASGLGKDLTAVQAILPGINDLMAAARSHGIPVFVAQTTTDKSGHGDTPASIYYREVKPANGAAPAGAIRFGVVGTPGHDIVPDIKLEASDIVVAMPRLSVFYGTNVVSTLHGMGIESVIVTGVTTGGAVASTAGDALSKDFYPVVVEDCVADYDEAVHKAAMTVLDSRYTVVEAATIGAEWESSLSVH